MTSFATRDRMMASSEYKALEKDPWREVSTAGPYTRWVEGGTFPDVVNVKPKVMDQLPWHPPAFTLAERRLSELLEPLVHAVLPNDVLGFLAFPNTALFRWQNPKKLPDNTLYCVKLPLCMKAVQASQLLGLVRRYGQKFPYLLPACLLPALRAFLDGSADSLTSSSRTVSLLRALLLAPYAQQIRDTYASHRLFGTDLPPPFAKVADAYVQPIHIATNDPEPIFMLMVPSSSGMEELLGLVAEIVPAYLLEGCTPKGYTARGRAPLEYDLSAPSFSFAGHDFTLSHQPINVLPETPYLENFEAYDADGDSVEYVNESCDVCGRDHEQRE